MKAILNLVVAASLIMSSQGAFAIALPKKPGGPNVVSSTCPASFSLPGLRVTEDDISNRKDATVRFLEECSASYIIANFAVANAAAAIESNKNLKAYLRHQGIVPQDVVAALLVRGELVVYVENT